jgi:Xaa-Pro dipeptidase
MQSTSQRIERVHRSMQREGVDAILVTRRTDVHYLTGYESVAESLPVGSVIVEGQLPYLIVPELQRQAMGQDSSMVRVHSFADEPSEQWFPNHGPGFWDCVNDVLREAGIRSGTIGLQHDWLSIREFEALKSAFPDAGFKDFSRALWRLRQIKDAAEIDAIRQAVKIAEIGVRTALETVVSGKTEGQCSVEIEAAMRAAGGELRGIRAAVLAGGHARYPFAQPTTMRVSSNELVLVDVTVSQSGYLAEVARTVHAGTPSGTQRRLFGSVLATNNALQSVMTPEVKISEAAAQALKIAGNGTQIRGVIQPLGSSIGLDIREPPYICQESKSTFREGMVFSIHPTIYESEAGCAKIADVLAITAEGCESLTSLSKETL